MHMQEVAQEVLAPQEHASSEKKLSCTLSARTSKRKKFKILSTRSRKKLRVLRQTANTRKKFTVVGLISNRQGWTLSFDLKMNDLIHKRNVIIHYSFALRPECRAHLASFSISHHSDPVLHSITTQYAFHEMNIKFQFGTSSRSMQGVHHYM